MFQDTLDRIAGATELQITAGEPGFDEEVLERVQSLAEVRVAAPVIEAVVGTRLAGQGNLLILGVDMTGDRSLREYDLAAGDEAMLDDPLVFLAQPDSIMISAPFAERNALRLGSRVPLDTIDGPKDFIVRGILRAGGMSQAFGGNLAVMDIYAAQHVFGRGRKFDRIDLALVPGADLARTQAALQAMLGSGFEVQSPATRGQGFESLVRIYRFMLHFSSAFALIVGMFLIYNAFAIAVTQRRGEIGLLRALGATRGQVWRLFLMESVALAVVGSRARRLRRSGGRGRGGARHGAAAARRVRSCRLRRRADRAIAGCRRHRDRDRPRDQRTGGRAAGAQCRAHRSDQGAAEGPAPGARRRQQPRPDDRRGGVGRRRRRPPRRDRHDADVLSRLPVRAGGDAADRARARAVADARDPADPARDSAGRRRTGRRQPDRRADAHVRDGRRADALARAGDRAGRRRARQLRAHRRLDEHGAQSRPVRHQLAEPDGAHLQVSRCDDRRSGGRSRASRRCSGSAPPASRWAAAAC